MQIETTNDLSILLQYEYERLRRIRKFNSVSFHKFVDNIIWWCWQTLMIESGRGRTFSESVELWDRTEQGFIQNKTTSAHSYYQFLTKSGTISDSLDVALNRLEVYVKLGIMSKGAIESIRGCRINQSLFTRENGEVVLVEHLEFQTLLLLANLFRQKGTDRYFKRIAKDRDEQCSIELYTEYHHTNPDDATLKRLESFYV